MNKTLLIAAAIVILVGGFVIFNKKLLPQKQVANLKQTEKKIAKDLGLKEGSKFNFPTYNGAKVDEDKCGKEAFYVQEKSTDFVKNYCKFLRDSGWNLVHQDYADCEDIKSFGGGYNYEKGQEKIAVSVIKYGDDATCFWVFKR